jgi:hypothetical protein
MTPTFTPEQQKANRKLWFDELETTQVKQGRGVLNRNNETYCCLGLACEVAIKNGLNLGKIKMKDGNYLYGEDNVALLPQAMTNWLGLRHCAGESESGQLDSCVRMNDSLRLSFKEIGKRLQANEAEYFIVNGENDAKDTP